MMPRIRALPKPLRQLVPTSGVRCRSSRCSSAPSHSRRAFTVLELVVVISVVAILTSILMPALSKVREAGERVQCASNLRQVGCALIDYGDDHRERIPHLAYTAENSFSPQFSEAMALTNWNGREPDGLGRLLIGIGGGYLSDPRVLYCPCHRGDHTFKRYENQLMVRTPSGFGEKVFGNYHYRGNLDPVTGQLFLHTRRSDTVLVVDGLRTRQDFSHVRGTNRLKVDCSVDWQSDYSGTIYRSLPVLPNPTADASIFQTVWKLIDSHYIPVEDDGGGDGGGGED